MFLIQKIPPRKRDVSCIVLRCSGGFVTGRGESLMEQESTELETGTERWPLIRDVLVFQGKLLVGGLRDLVLLPVSLIVGIVSIIGTGKGSPPGREFYDLLHAARRSERWINLFGAAGKRV